MSQDFDLMIGRMDRILSEMVLTAKNPGAHDVDESDWQTLKHHAEDLISAGERIIKAFQDRGPDDEDSFGKRLEARMLFADEAPVDRTEANGYSAEYNALIDDFVEGKRKGEKEVKLALKEYKIPRAAFMHDLKKAGFKGPSAAKLALDAYLGWVYRCSIGNRAYDLSNDKPLMKIIKAAGKTKKEFVADVGRYLGVDFEELPKPPAPYIWESDNDGGWVQVKPTSKKPSKSQAAFEEYEALVEAAADHGPGGKKAETQRIIKAAGFTHAQFLTDVRAFKRSSPDRKAYFDMVAAIASGTFDGGKRTLRTILKRAGKTHRQLDQAVEAARE